ncbi:hypothetical protein VNI00_000995 [Paramarasmius palmivorus]|uniref:Box C/D snoRNA protein 1 n=1 Tax=Paramarasmius palmivorus TaxID=297713 RepID=A0AAW0E5U0_9AGAR
MSASTSTTVLCSICSQNPPKYTCPRCSIRTCSAPCSKKHKEGQGCSGVRDPTRYTPMNNYGYMSLMNDYVYLEDVGRRAKEWGTEIVKGGYQPSHAVQSQSFHKRGVRGRGRGAGANRGGREKLVEFLATHGIHMESLPAGMERKARNMSSFRGNHPNQQAFLSIEFKFHPPKNVDPQPESLVVLAHNNSVSSPLIELIHNSISSHRKKKGKGKEKEISFDWLSEDAYTEDDIVCLIPTEAPLPSSSTYTPPVAYPPQPFPFNAPASLPTKRKATTKYFHRLDPTIPLLTSLSNCRCRFVEFPTIEVFHGDEFDGVVVDPNTGVLEDHTEEATATRVRPAKRRKLKPDAIRGLLGDYGSDSDAQEEGEKKTGLGMLNYESSSDSEVDSGQQVLDEGSADEDEDEEVNQDISPEVLMQLIKQAAKNDGGEDDELDWGVSDEET